MGTRLVFMKYLQLLVFVLIIQHNAFGQSLRHSYCGCQIVGEEQPVKDKDSIFVEAHYNKEMLRIEIINNTRDTIFLFNSYFDKNITSSKYIYRYDKKNKSVNISFLPLIPYLFTRYSDRIVLQDRIVKEYQTVYDFYKIPPYYKHTLNIDVLDLKGKKVV